MARFREVELANVVFTLIPEEELTVAPDSKLLPVIETGAL